MVDYDSIFADPDYNPPDKERMHQVLRWIKAKNYKDIVDAGCGRGHYIKYLSKWTPDICGFEPSHYLIKHDLKNMPVVEADIISYKSRHEALYCMDVLEHIDPNELQQNLTSLSKIADHALLGIANHPDVWDKQDIHLIQEDGGWWHQQLEQYYKTVNNLFNSDRYIIFEVHQ